VSTRQDLGLGQGQGEGGYRHTLAWAAERGGALSSDRTRRNKDSDSPRVLKI
jgi:hypothetical protein